MASNGGVATPSMVAERPVLTLLSGPAAGVIGGFVRGYSGFGFGLAAMPILMA